MRRSWRKVVVSWLFPSATAVLLIGCPPGPPTGTDLTVSSLEVTQGIQTGAGSVQLVAQRSTAVRATLGTAVGVPVPGVTGRLHVFVNGVEITPVAGLSPVAVISAPPAPQRTNETDTLNFELPSPSGISASADVDFRVDASVSGESNTANNSGSANNLSFVNRVNPSLFFTRINYTPSGLGLPNLADVQRGVGDMFVRGIYPVNDGDPNLYRQGLFPTLTYTEDSNGDGILEALGADGNDLISLLASCRQLIVNGGLGASDKTFLYGWIAGNPINGNGLGQVGGFNAFGNTQLTRHQRSYAHELGHNFGLNHNSTTISPEVGWDVGARLPGNPAGNNTTGRLKGTALNDIMVGGQLTNSAWVTTTTYNFFSSSPILAGVPDLQPAQTNFPTRTLVVQGLFDPQGTKLLSLKPTVRFPWASQPTSREQQGPFTVQVIDDAQLTTQIRFNPRIADDSGKEDEPFGFFEVMVPVAAEREVVALRITDQTGAVLGGFERSAPPTISLVTPEPGAKLDKQTTVTWKLADRDTPLENLRLQVAYSPNNGESWVPVAVDVSGKETGVSFDSTQIQKSDGSGLIRVFVGDGLNTVSTEVRGLSAPLGQF